MITNRPRRLDGVSYVGLQRYFLTTCTAFRRKVFITPAVVTSVVDQLLQNAEKFEFAVVAYCVMPDHLHVLVEARADHSDLTVFMKRFKQMTGFAYRRDNTIALWQPGYHEHILRDEYPFAGSAVYEMEDLLVLWERQQA